MSLNGTVRLINGNLKRLVVLVLAERGRLILLELVLLKTLVLELQLPSPVLRYS